MQRVRNILSGKDSAEYADSSELSDKIEPRFSEKIGNLGDSPG